MNEDRESVHIRRHYSSGSTAERLTMLIRPDVTDYNVNQAFDYLKARKGMTHVHLTWSSSERNTIMDEAREMYYAYQDRKGIDRGDVNPGEVWDYCVHVWIVRRQWRCLTVMGTETGVRKARGYVKNFLGITNDDPNADHDHAKCIADAAAQGVPAAYAHRPETYLSM